MPYDTGSATPHHHRFDAAAHRFRYYSVTGRRRFVRRHTLVSEVVMGLLIFLAVVVALAFWTIGAYNSLIALKNRVLNAWKQIDVQLKRRHDLIPNLIESVKGAMNFERETLEAVISARAKAMSAQGVKATAEAEGMLTQALGKLFALSEAYPDLKATGNIGQLQEELTNTENKIAFSRQLYNDEATLYNTKQGQFPTNLVAGLAKATPAELWEIDDPAERAVPKVDFGFNKPPVA
jgi:LemA protein